MMNKSRHTELFHVGLRQMSVAVFAAIVLLAVPVVGNAQATSSSIGGVISDKSGGPIAGAVVTVRNDDMGLTRSTQTDDSGKYRLRNMPIGYNFTVSATASGFKGGELTGVSVNLGKVAEVDMALVGADLDEVVVTASRPVGMQLALGPSATFGLDELQSAPAINRNITDVLRADARIYVDESRGDINAIQCAGKNSRFNSLTVDGVRMNDSFGLNSNGYPTERMPFSYDAINQVSVELAPFDVQYGGFSACNINAVTKSGSNTFAGSAFFDYTSDSLRGDSLEGEDIQSNSYTENRYGFTFGGPIIRDTLFFFMAYEKLDGANLFDRGAIGSGAVNEVMVTQADLDRISQIARDVYFYDTGDIPSVKDNEDEKLLLKFDWNITDSQRAVITYVYNDGDNKTMSDSASNEIEFSEHLYERGAEMNAFGVSLYSDWTDNFSTEIRVSHIDLDNRQVTLGPQGFGEIRVELGRDSSTISDIDVYLGGDDSRQSNKLDYTVDTISLKGKFDLGDHSLTVGLEREELDVFNLFVQHTETELRFNSMDDFEAGFADDVYYNNAPSQNPDDAAAVWDYAINTVFIQDEWQVSDRWTLLGGLRYDFFTTGTKPPLNTEFLADYGFPNTNTVDGIGLLQPRIGFSFDMSSDTVIRGGAGLYSGGNPNVWLSNNYSNNNVVQFGAYRPDYDLTADTFEDIEPGAPAGAWAGWGIPTALWDEVASGTGSNFEINYLDPDFELPSEWKFALGITHIFPSDLVLSADLLVTRAQDTAMALRGDLRQIGTTSDGYPIYDSPLMDSFVLTNSSTGDRSFGYSVGVAKDWDNGFDLSIGYSYSDAEDVQPMTSSVAFSNYQNRAFFDPQEDLLSRSNYNIEHRWTFMANWRKDLWTRSLLTVSLFGTANSGRPFSYAFNGTVVPYNFNPYLDFRDNVLMPGVDRNGEDGSWWRKLDFRINLDLPGFREDHRSSVFLVIDNLSNLLNDDWGVLRQHNFPRTVVEGTQEPRLGDASRYEIRFGVQYQF